MEEPYHIILKDCAPEIIEKAFGEAKKVAEEKVKERAMNANNTHPIGRPRNHRQTTVLGRDADYLSPRIARDQREVLKRMKAGEFKSVRAAAVEWAATSRGR